MARGTVVIDYRGVLRGISILTSKIESGGKKGRQVVGDELLRLSQIEVPHDEGTMANTGVSEPDGDDHIVGYNTPYAAKLHEHPEYNFGKGRKGKYLEDPIKANRNEFGKIYADTAGKEL